MSEPLNDHERKWASAKRARFGPYELRVRRRNPDDPEDRHPTAKALDDLAEAWRELGHALLDTAPGRGAIRVVEWLDRILTRRKR